MPDSVPWTEEVWRRVFPFMLGRTLMEEHQESGTGPDPADLEPIPMMQRVLDNPFLLLVLGILVPTIFYIVWGIIEITQIPIAD